MSNVSVSIREPDKKFQKYGQNLSFHSVKYTERSKGDIIMLGIEALIPEMFDWQRFANDKELDMMISDTLTRYGLSDEQITDIDSLAAAAGGISGTPDRRRDET